jgi:hypothetical protein
LYWVENEDIFWFKVGEEDFHTNWNRLHEVWEKVREEIGKVCISYFYNTSRMILNGTKLEAFKALYDCIQFINNLKQQENGNKDI